MARGWEYHHDGSSDIALWNGSLNLQVDDLASGSPAVKIYSNTANTGTLNNLLLIQNDNSSTNKDTVQIKNDGTGKGLVLDQNGNAIALDIDSEATTASAVLIDQLIADGSESFRIKHGGVAKFNLERNDALTRDSVLIRLGNSYLWVDADGKLRMWSGSAVPPTSDLSGSAIGP